MAGALREALAPARSCTDCSADVCAETFRTVARRLLCGFVLAIGDREYRLAEIEFYCSSATHADPFVHGAPEQLGFAQWYFHRASAHGAYRGGTFKGLDLTFGDEAAGLYGGILLRAIASADTDEFVDGSCNVVDCILANLGMASIAELVAAAGSLDAADCPLVRLRPAAAEPEPAVFASPRVGLTLKKLESAASPRAPAYARFVAAPLRFLTRPASSGKRFYAVVGLLMAGIADPAELARLVGCTERVASGYAAAFAAGLEGGALDGYCGAALSTADTCAMLGAAVRLSTASA